jgi:hypothetical protein
MNRDTKIVIAVLYGITALFIFLTVVVYAATLPTPLDRYFANPPALKPRVFVHTPSRSGFMENRWGNYQR